MNVGMRLRPRSGETRQRERQDDHEDRVRRDRPAHVGDVDHQVRPATRVAHVQAERQRDDRRGHEGDRRQRQVLEEPVRDPGGPLPVGGVEEPVDDVHQPALRTHPGPGCDPALEADEQEVRGEGEQDRQAGAQQVLRREERLETLGDQLAEAAEVSPPRIEATVASPMTRHRREAQARDHQRDANGNSTRRAVGAGCSPSPRPPRGRPSGRRGSRRRCSGTGSAACRS